jgi:hypothetical protein
MSIATLISLVSLALGAIGLLLSRVVTRRVRVRVHRARFVGGSGYGPECYFVNITNISLNREVEVTHVWVECPGAVHIVRNERPLPKRLRADETWETWIGVDQIPAALSDFEVFKLARVRISTGKVFRSRRNKRVPSLGYVPGSDLPGAPSGKLKARSEITKAEPHDQDRHGKSFIDAKRAVDLLRNELAENVEGLRFDDPAVYEWWSITQRILEEAFGEHSRQVNHFVCGVGYSDETEEDKQERHVQTIGEKKGMLRAFIKELDLFAPERAECKVPQDHHFTASTAYRPSKVTAPSLSPTAFVSHGTLDHPFVETFAADLRANGVDAWFSKWEIKPGDSIRAKIEEGLEGCEYFIIVLSKNSINRPWVQTELDAATIRKLSGKVLKIIPVKIEDCGDLPPTLGALLWEDFSNQPYEAALKRVLDSIFGVDVRPPLWTPRSGNKLVAPIPDQTFPQTGSQEHGPVLELRRGDPTVQINDGRYFYSLTLANTQEDFEAPALDVKAELSFRHKTEAPIVIPSAPLMDRHTLDRQDVITCVFPVLRNSKTVEIVLVGQSKDYMRFHTMRCPLAESTDEEITFALGIWTCDVRVTADFDYDGVRKRLALDSAWTVQIALGYPADIKLLPANNARVGNDSLFMRKFLWNEQAFYRCSVCEFDNQDRTTLEEHTRQNHGFAIGEEEASVGLNLLIANASGAPLSNCRLTLVDFRKWDKGLRQFHPVYEMRDFQPIGLRGNYSPIYVGKPAVFQLVDAVDPTAPIIRAVPVLTNAVNWIVPSPGIWRGEFEVQFSGKNPTRFYKCVDWDGTKTPKFVLCP